MIDHTSEVYRTSVVRALTGQDDNLVFNGTIDHAAVVVENAFRTASKHVRILTSRLDLGCYGGQSVKDAALDFLGKADTRLDILIEDPASVSVGARDLLKQLESQGGGRVRVQNVDIAYLSGYSFNFLTVDDQSYRFEADRSKPIAVVAGGAAHRTTVNRLIDIFDRLFATSRPQDLVLSPSPS